MNCISRNSHHAGVGAGGYDISPGFAGADDQVSAGALWTRLLSVAASTPPGVFEGRAGTPVWNGRGTAPARQTGLVARPERFDPLVQLLQPLQ